MVLMATGTVKKPSARERLLGAANELFYSEGVQTVGIDRIIEHAGVAKASLYNTYGSKEVLIAAYLDLRGARIKDAITRTLTRFRTPREQLLGIFDAQGEMFTRGQPDPPRRREAPDLAARPVRRTGRAVRIRRPRGPGPPVAPALRRRPAVRAYGPRPLGRHHRSRRRGRAARRGSPRARPGLRRNGKRLQIAFSCPHQ
jgi:AcrR family transcriptional regulator